MSILKYRVIIDSSFKALPGTNFTDWTILSYVKTLSKYKFVSVSYIAEQINFDRSTVSRKLSKMVDSGFIERITINFKKVKYVLTQKALDLISLFVKQEAEEKREEIREKNEAYKRERAAFGNESQVGATQTAETTKDSQNNIDPYSEDRRTQFKKLFSNYANLPKKQLSYAVDDYFDYCQIKGAAPSRSGLANRLNSVLFSLRESLKGKSRSEALSSAKDKQAAQLIKKIKPKTTQDRLSDQSWWYDGLHAESGV